jgi:hypothetical protein
MFRTILIVQSPLHAQGKMRNRRIRRRQKMGGKDEWENVKKGR